MSMILESFEDLTSPIGYWIKKEIHFDASFTAVARAALIFPRGATRCRIKINDDNCELGSTQLFYIKSGSSFKISSTSTIGHVIILLPTNEKLLEMKHENFLPDNLYGNFFSNKTANLTLSRWMNDLIDRYDFERRLNERTPAQCPFFLEKQILNEFARLAFPGAVPTTGKLLGNQGGELVVLAVRFIESHLFDNLTSDHIAKHLGISVSHLEKIFQKELKRGPIAFTNDLRLEMAARLLEEGEWSATNLAHLCGFSELSAFSRAFKKKFGFSPKSSRKGSHTTAK